MKTIENCVNMIIFIMFMSVLLLIAFNNCVGCESSKEEHNPHAKLDSNKVNLDRLKK